jgi:uncharacterized membrane protein
MFFIFSNYVYEKSNWSSKKISTLQYIYAAIIAIPFGLTLMYLFYNNVFVTLEFLDTRNYWEQIILIFGFITFFYVFRIYLLESKFDKERKQKVIDEQSNTIRQLKELIETFKKDEKKTPKLTRSERILALTMKKRVEDNNNPSLKNLDPYNESLIDKVTPPMTRSERIKAIAFLNYIENKKLKNTKD